jgi:hypothetical protein
MGQLAVILLRLVVPLTILRWPLAGGLIAMLLDALDVVLIEMFGGSFDNYPALDKGLDTYYLALEVFVSLRWEPLLRWTSVALFAYRTVGVIAFEVTQTRWLLLVFPNLFENFYIAYLVLRRVAPAFAITPLRLAGLLVLLLIPKLGQEYLLHYSEAQPWDWIKRNVLRDAWQF